MSNNRMRVLAVVFMVNSLSFAQARQGGEGGVDVGNGGNGILETRPDKTEFVRLLDLVEGTTEGVVDPDAVVKANLSARGMSQNYVIQRRVRNLLKEKFRAPVEGSRDDARIAQALATQLSVLAYRYPAVVDLVLNGIQTMEWVPAEAPLKFNRDAQNRLELKENQTEIGCANNESDRVLYSPVCERKMSPGHFAALIVHEVVYDYLVERNPHLVTQKDSTPVRIVVAAIFSARAEHNVLGSARPDFFRSNVSKINLGGVPLRGLKELFDADQLVNTVFFPDSRSFVSRYKCTFEGSSLTPALKRVDLTLQFRGAYYVSGDVRFADSIASEDSDAVCSTQIFGYANRLDPVQQSCTLNPKLQLPRSWILLNLPTFNVNDRMMSLVLSRSTTREQIKLKLYTQQDGPASVMEYANEYDDSIKDYRGKVSLVGRCERGQP